jgi:prepilin-type processing-associated H-X9-DG protein
MSERETQKVKAKILMYPERSLWHAKFGWLCFLFALIILFATGSRVAFLLLIVALALNLSALLHGAISLIVCLRRGTALEGVRKAVAGVVLSSVYVALVGLYVAVLVIASLPPPPRMLCGVHLSELGKAMFIYANNNNGKYPTTDKWCDLLIKHADVTEKQFICYGALKQKDKSRCHYALNANCEPNSPPDIVLLFETKGGWNLSGGPELLTTENHEGKGCNVLFNDSHAEFITLKDVPELKWKEKQKE